MEYCRRRQRPKRWHMFQTNLTSPELHSTFEGTPVGFEMSNMCSIKTTVSQTLSSAKNLPGQILPNEDVLAGAASS